MQLGSLEKRISSPAGCIITHPMLRLLLSKAQGCKYFCKPSKPCHVGIDCIALAEYSDEYQYAR